MATATQNHQAWLKLIEAARDAGVPKEQLRNFLNAAYVPMEHQLPFHAAARACDAPDGPNEVAQGGARGPGKSHSTLAQIGLDDCQRQPGHAFDAACNEAGSQHGADRNRRREGHRK